MIGLNKLTVYSGKILQTALNEKGAKLLIDGIIGPKSLKALIDFQVENNIPLTDQVDSVLEKLGLGYTLSLRKVFKEEPIDLEEERPAPPLLIDASDYKVPKFVTVPGVRFNEYGPYKTPTGMFEGLIPHYTVSGRTERSAIGVLKYLAKKRLGCMVMDEDGVIYVAEGFDPLRDSAGHAGKSKWGGRSSLNRYYAGMEICCWGRGSKVGPYRSSKGEANIIAGKYQKFTKAQEESLVNFILWALDVNPEFKIANIAGHDEVRALAGSPGGKQDPGASLSMTMPEFRKLIGKLAKG